MFYIYEWILLTIVVEFKININYEKDSSHQQTGVT